MADFNIPPITVPVIAPGTVPGGNKDNTTETDSFGSVLDQSIKTVSRIQQDADERAAQLVAGESKDIHGTMIAMQKAEISMSLLMEVRNKVISAYDEIKRMQF